MKHVITLLVIAVAATTIQAQQPAAVRPNEQVKTLVGRLDLEKYKATIKGLTQFGDRRQGTERNRKAVDWIEAQLESYGCTNAERLEYEYNTPPQQQRTLTAADSAAIAARREAAARNTQASDRGS